MSDYKFKSYTEVLTDAAPIHPDAQVRMGADGRWEIVIPTPFLESMNVTESWAGTPAEKAFNTMSSGGDDELTRWGYKNGYSEYPLELLAERYNIVEDSQAWGQTRMKEELKKIGLKKKFYGNTSSEITPSDMSVYEALRIVIGAEMDEKFAARAAALDAKLGYASGVLN